MFFIYEDDLGSMQMTPVASGSETETWKDPPSHITMKHYEGEENLNEGGAIQSGV